MTRAASTYSARSVHGCGPTRAVVVVGEEWAEVVRSSPDRKVVGAGPVDSRHGSYQLVSWWGGHCLCPSMAMLGGDSQRRDPDDAANLMA